jgi:hypothetical protein
MIDLNQLDRLMEQTPPAWLLGEAEYDERDQRVAVASTSRRTIRYDSPKRIARRLGRRAACLEQLAPLPAEGEELVLLLDGRWHGWDLIAGIRELAGCPITQLHVATLGFNRDQTHQLAADLDAEQIGEVAMLVSEMFRDKNPGEFAELKRSLTERGQQLAATRNHAKLLCLELADGRRFACHGSLNLRRCNSVEPLAISTDPTLYGFFTSYIQEAVEAAG